MDPERNHRVADRLGVIALLLSIVLALLTLAAPAFAAPTFPPLTGRVTDAAGVMTADRVAALDSRLAALETATSTSLVVATVPDLQGLEIEEYGYQLGRAWGIGQKGTNNGVILLVAPNERKVRIEVGYGLEGTLTDALTSQIIRRSIIPQFKAGDMPAGIEQGADALIALLQLPPEEAQAAALAAKAAQSERGGSDGLRVAVWIIIILVWIFISVARGGRGRRRGSSIIWGPGLGGWGGGGGGGWGGGGGGGFSGGGGSFGGGGSSGSW